MPFYDYHCPANGRTVEVSHRMSERVETWGRLCEIAGLDADGTPPEAPVERLLNRQVAVGSRAAAARAPGPGPCSRPGGCGCH